MSPEANSCQNQTQACGRQAKPATQKSRKQIGTRRNQFSSFVLFSLVIVLVNLCPYQSDLEAEQQTVAPQTQLDSLVSGTKSCLSRMAATQQPLSADSVLKRAESCLAFVKLMFSNPTRLSKRTTRFTLSEARLLGKMAKVWYIKKKVKKLSKKLKKHTIAVPVFTAIPIYEHSYYPQPHVTHVSHHGLHHAASSYSPAIAQLAAAASAPSHPQAAGAQLAAAASNHAIAAYRLPPAHHAQHQPHHAHHSHQNGAPNLPYNPIGHAAAANQIINSYVPSPPLYVDEAGGLYGHYGNAYGRYDGGYQMW